MSNPANRCPDPRCERDPHKGPTHSRYSNGVIETWTDASPWQQGVEQQSPEVPAPRETSHLVYLTHVELHNEARARNREATRALVALDPPDPKAAK